MGTLGRSHAGESSKMHGRTLFAENNSQSKPEGALVRKRAPKFKVASGFAENYCQSEPDGDLMQVRAQKCIGAPGFE